jgi:phage/plasmid-associated DNA primase
MTFTAADLEHLKAEGWEKKHIDWANGEYGVRSISSQEAEGLHIGCYDHTKTVIHPSGLFFPYGDSRLKLGNRDVATYGQLRCHEKIRRPGGGIAPKYLPTVGVAPIPWLPADALAITEGWKDAAASYIRHDIPVGAIGAPAYFRCLAAVDPGIPLILDADTPFVKEVWRILVSAGIEQNRRIGHLPWMDAYPKGGFTEFCFGHGASQQDVMNVIGSAARPRDYLGRLAELWAKATDDQWRAANKGAELGRVPLLKSGCAEQLAKTAARCLSVGEAGALFNVICKPCGVTKGHLTSIFNAKQAEARRTQRLASRRDRIADTQPIYEVDPTTTIEATVLHNLQVANGGGMVARNLQFWRWEDDLHHWVRRSGHEIKAWLAKDLERYCQAPLTDKDLPRFVFSTTEYIKRLSSYLQIRLDDQRLDASPHLIPFSNGVLDVTTGELLEHDPALGCTFCIQGDYQAPGTGKLGPAFTHLLNTSYEKAAHQMIRAALRMLIDPTMPPGKFVALIGQTRSGKGALLGVIRHLFPPHAISNLHALEQVQGKEAIYQSVLGKRLIAFGDLLGKQTKYGSFYELVDQSMVTARKLFESEEVSVDFNGRFVLAMTKVPIFADDNGYTGWVGRAFSIPTIPGERDRSLFPNLEQALTTEIGTIASWALAMDRQEAIDILQGRSDDQEIHRAQAAAASGIDSLSEFIDKCLVPADPLVIPDISDLIDAYRLFCHVTGKNPLADARFIGQLRTALAHLDQPRRKMPRTAAREQGIDVENRWLPRRFFGFTIDEQIWRREATDVEGLGLKTFGSSDFRSGIDWENTLSAWDQAGLVFDWDRDRKRAKTGFIHRDTLHDAEGRLLELRQHKPEAPDE